MESTINLKEIEKKHFEENNQVGLLELVMGCMQNFLGAIVFIRFLHKKSQPGKEISNDDEN